MTSFIVGGVRVSGCVGGVVVSGCGGGGGGVGVSGCGGGGVGDGADDNNTLFHYFYHSISGPLQGALNNTCILIRQAVHILTGAP